MSQARLNKIKVILRANKLRNRHIAKGELKALSDGDFEVIYWASVHVLLGVPGGIGYGTIKRGFEK